MNCPHRDDSWCLDCVKAEWERTQAETERLQAIVDRLPRTADGVPVIPGVDAVWVNHYWLGTFETKEWTPEFSHVYYSTREAAEKARKRGSHDKHHVATN